MKKVFAQQRTVKRMKKQAIDSEDYIYKSHPEYIKVSQISIRKYI